MAVCRDADIYYKVGRRSDIFRASADEVFLSRSAGLLDYNFCCGSHDCTIVHIVCILLYTIPVTVIARALVLLLLRIIFHCFIVTAYYRLPLFALLIFQG